MDGPRHATEVKFKHPAPPGSSATNWRSRRWENVEVIMVRATDGMWAVMSCMPCTPLCSSSCTPARSSRHKITNASVSNRFKNIARWTNQQKYAPCPTCSAPCSWTPRLRLPLLRKRQANFKHTQQKHYGAALPEGEASTVNLIASTAARVRR